MIPFKHVRKVLNEENPSSKFEGRLLALDPGETTGVAGFTADAEEAVLTYANQIKTWPLEVGVSQLTKLLDSQTPDVVVFESYQVYEWKTSEHSWSQIPTVQVIGAVKTLLIQRDIPYYTQTAQVAKKFVDDEKLEKWGFWHKGMRHARDATRHGCYFLLFGPKKDS